MTTVDYYIKTEWDLHANFVKALIKQLDASPNYDSMGYKQLGARLMYATLELQCSDKLMEWIDGLMDRLKESISALQTQTSKPDERNISSITANIDLCRKCLQGFETLAHRHSVDYMSLWTHKKRDLAELEKRRQDPGMEREMEDMYQELRDLDLKSNYTKSSALLVQKFLLGQTQQTPIELNKTTSYSANRVHSGGSVEGH